MNPFDIGCFSNWTETMCQPVPLSFIKFKRKKQRERENYQTQLLIAKYKMIKYNSQTASIKAATNKLANNSTNSIIYTTKPGSSAKNGNPNKELNSLMKKSKLNSQQLKPLREDDVDEVNNPPLAFPTKFEPAVGQTRKKSSKSSTSNSDMEYIYDNGSGEHVWVDRKPQPYQQQQQQPHSKTLYKNNANFVQHNVNSQLHNGSYRAMDKNVGTNLEQQLSRAAAKQNSNSKMKYMVDETNDLIIKPMSGDANNYRVKAQPQQQRHVSTKHIVLSANVPPSLSDDNFSGIDVRPMSAGPRNGNGYTPVEIEVPKASSKGTNRARPVKKGSEGNKNGALLLMQQHQHQHQPKLMPQVKSNRNGDSRNKNNNLIRKSQIGGDTNNRGDVAEEDFDSYEITV